MKRSILSRIRRDSLYFYRDLLRRSLLIWRFLEFSDLLSDVLGSNARIGTNS